MSRLNVLNDEFTKVRAGIDAIEARAEAEGRDLTDAEVSDSDALYAHAEAMKADIEPLAEKARSIAATADVLSRIGVSRPAPQRNSAPATVPTAAEYIAGYVNSYRGAAEADEFHRSIADLVLADVPGIVPTPIVGELIKFADDRRPVFDSFTQRPMPASGASFNRPRLTQRGLVAEQSAEKTEVASRKFTVTSDNVVKHTYAGVIDISVQVQDWTDPSVLALVLDDFVGEYASVVEQAFCNDFVAALAYDSPFVTTTTADVLESLTTAAIAVYSASKSMPDTMWLSLDEWGVLASLVDGQDRPLFPSLGAGSIDISTGNFSGSPLGLKVVVGPDLESGTVIIGASRYAEAYEQKKGFLRVDVPSVLGTDIAVYGYVASYIRPEGFVYCGNLT